jgi:hypothetical protein
MDERQFVVVARIRTTDREGIQIVLASFLPPGSVTPTDEGNRVLTAAKERAGIEQKESKPWQKRFALRD